MWVVEKKKCFSTKNIAHFKISLYFSLIYSDKIPIFYKYFFPPSHLLRCFSSVDWTVKGISHRAQRRMPLPLLTWIFMCLVSLLLWAQEYSHLSHLYGFSPVWDRMCTVRLEVFLNTLPQNLQVSFLVTRLWPSASRLPRSTSYLMRLGSMGGRMVGREGRGGETGRSGEPGQVELTSPSPGLRSLRSSASSVLSPSLASMASS